MWILVVITHLSFTNAIISEYVSAPMEFSNKERCEDVAKKIALVEDELHHHPITFCVEK